jgi:hypothetical protein
VISVLKYLQLRLAPNKKAKCTTPISFYDTL